MSGEGKKRATTTITNCSNCARCSGGVWGTPGAGLDGTGAEGETKEAASVAGQLDKRPAECERRQHHKALLGNAACIENGSRGSGGGGQQDELQYGDVEEEYEDEEVEEEDEEEGRSCASSTVSVCASNSAASAGLFTANPLSIGGGGNLHGNNMHLYSQRHATSTDHHASVGNIRSASRFCDGDCCPTCSCNNSQNSNQSDQQISAPKQQKRPPSPSTADTSNTQQRAAASNSAKVAANSVQRESKDVVVVMRAHKSADQRPTTMVYKTNDGQSQPSQAHRLIWLLGLLWRRLKAATGDGAKQVALDAELEVCQMCRCPLNDGRASDQQTRTSLGSTTCIMETEPAEYRKINQSGLAVAAANIAVSTTALATVGGGSSRQQQASSSPRANHSCNSCTVVANPMLKIQQTTLEGLESKRERKAAKTLAIITGVFVMCWLPFFIMAITMPLLELRPPKYLFAFLLWLGYFNSMLNPIIYTIFSPDFRKAFKRLLCAMEPRTPGSSK